MKKWKSRNVLMKKNGSAQPKKLFSPDIFPVPKHTSILKYTCHVRTNSWSSISIFVFKEQRNALSFSTLALQNVEKLTCSFSTRVSLSECGRFWLPLCFLNECTEVLWIRRNFLLLDFRISLVSKGISMTRGFEYRIEKTVIFWRSIRGQLGWVENC